MSRDHTLPVRSEMGKTKTSTSFNLAEKNYLQGTREDSFHPNRTSSSFSSKAWESMRSSEQTTCTTAGRGIYINWCAIRARIVTSLQESFLCEASRRRSPPKGMGARNWQNLN